MIRSTGSALAAMLLLAAPAQLRANAFPMPAGEGRLIVTPIYSVADKGFNNRGNAVDIPRYRVAESYFQIEYGLTSDLTLLLTPSLRDISVRGGRDTSGLGYTDIGARYRIANLDGWNISLQGLARIPGKKRRDIAAQIGSTDMEYDLRATVGRGFSIGKRDGFFSLEGSYRFRDDDPPDETHVDASLGYRATDRLLLLINSYNTFSNGRGRGLFDYRFRYHDVFASGVYDLNKSVSLQLGARATVAGRNALRERGAFAGLWFRF